MSDISSNTVEVVQVRSTSLVVYDRYLNSRSGVRLSVEEKKKLKENLRDSKTYSGNITKTSRKRLVKAVELLVLSARETTEYNRVSGKYYKHRISFITLTIPAIDKVTGKWGYKYLLSPFIKTMKRRGYFKTYVWKAELQKRGQLHYHITTHDYIDMQFVRDSWNNLLRRHNLTNNHINPSSTEIKEVKATKDLAAYLIKYISKTSEASIEGKVWGASDNLINGRYYTFELDNNTSNRLDKYLKKEEARLVVVERCSIVKGKSCISEVLSGYHKECLRVSMDSVIKKEEKKQKE